MHAPPTAVVAGLEAVEDCVIEAETTEEVDGCLPAISGVLWPDSSAPLTPNFGTSDEVLGVSKEIAKDTAEPSFFKGEPAFFGDAAEEQARGSQVTGKRQRAWQRGALVP